MAATSRRSRRFVIVGVAYLLVWQLATVVTPDRTTAAVLGVLGFVLHVVFGKAYALIPSYFSRSLASSRAAAVQLPLSAIGAATLAVAIGGLPRLGQAGALLWAAGTLVFLGMIVWTIRGNLTGAETGTGEVNEHRRTVDRLANALIPVALGYLAVGTYELVTLFTRAPLLFDGGLPVVMHLLAVGGAVTLFLGVGFRLFPRFLVDAPSEKLAGVVLTGGAVGPALLVTGFTDRVPLWLGAVVEAIAVLGFGGAFVRMFVRSDRNRVGFWSVLAGVVSGAFGVLLGVGFVLGVPRESSFVLAHLRLNVMGFLGLSIVGALYQFYPPAMGAFAWSDDRTALLSIAALTGGLWLETLGRITTTGYLTRGGAVLGFGGAALFASLLIGTLLAQSNRR